MSLFLACLSGALVLRAHEMLLRAPGEFTMTLPLRFGAPESDLHPFLATLLHLPQVTSLELLHGEAALLRAQRAIDVSLFGERFFGDAIELRVASLRDGAMLLRFLGQVRSQRLLDSSWIIAARTWQESVGEAMLRLRILRMTFLLFTGIGLALTLLCCMQILRSARAVSREETRLQKLLGAGNFTRHIPFLSALGTHLLPAIGVSLLLSLGAFFLFPPLLA